MTDPDDPRVAEFTRLTDVALRRVKDPAEGLYMAESRKVITPLPGCRAPSARVPDGAPVVRRVAGPAVPPGSRVRRVYVADDPVLERITGFKLHRGILASMHRPPLPALEEVLAGARRVAVLEDVVDHTNVGAMFRSAAASASTPCSSPRAARTPSTGARCGSRWAPCSRCRGPASTPGPKASGSRESGFTVAAAALAPDAVTLDHLAADLPERLALVLGTEGEGLDDRTVGRST